MLNQNIKKFIGQKIYTKHVVNIELSCHTVRCIQRRAEIGHRCVLQTKTVYHILAHVCCDYLDKYANILSACLGQLKKKWCGLSKAPR